MSIDYISGNLIPVKKSIILIMARHYWRCPRTEAKTLPA